MPPVPVPVTGAEPGAVDTAAVPETVVLTVPDFTQASRIVITAEAKSASVFAVVFMPVKSVVRSVTAVDVSRAI
jgi:hypothetical protein